MITALIAFAISVASLVALCVLAQRAWLDDPVAPTRSHVRVPSTAGSRGDEDGGVAE